MHLPAQGENDIAIVGINIKRLVTKRRYTATHELKGSGSTYICNLNNDTKIERYTENFAAELLIPYSEMKRQMEKYRPTDYLILNQVLEIADYFGASFLSCLLGARSMEIVIHLPQGSERKKFGFPCNRIRK